MRCYGLKSKIYKTQFSFYHNKYNKNSNSPRKGFTLEKRRNDKNTKKYLANIKITIRLN